MVGQARPIVHLLAGLPGSGKTTYALTLEQRGLTRVSVDERMLALHGQIGIDHLIDEHVDLLGPVLAWAEEQIVDLVGGGTSVVLDHGLGSRRDRDRFKLLAQRSGADWELAHFRADVSVLLDRLDRRAQRLRPASMKITPEMLRYLASVYEEPSGEGEQLIDDGTIGAEC